METHDRKRCTFKSQRPYTILFERIPSFSYCPSSNFSWREVWNVPLTPVLQYKMRTPARSRTHIMIGTLLIFSSLQYLQFHISERIFRRGGWGRTKQLCSNNSKTSAANVSPPLIWNHFNPVIYTQIFPKNSRVLRSCFIRSFTTRILLTIAYEL
jgi:hypothetical protein